MNKERIKWCFKQLLPFKYKSDYIENGHRTHCEWRMWFGKCFMIDNKILGIDQ